MNNNNKNNQQQKSLGIIIPAHNEQERIGSTLKEYTYYFNRLKQNSKLEDYEILVVINNTQDKTEEIVKSYQNLENRLDYLNLPKGGKGYATIEGFKYCLNKKLDLLGFVDADCSTSAEEFNHLASNIEEYDAVIASRHVKGAIVSPKQPIKRRIASRAFNLWVRILFPNLQYHDTQCGAKIFKTQPLSKVIDDVKTATWAFDVELLYHLKRKGYKINEVPTVWSEVPNSKFKLLSSGSNAVLDVLKLRLANLPFKNKN